MRLTGLVFGLLSSVAFADGTFGVPRSYDHWTLGAPSDAGSNPALRIQLRTRGVPVRSILLYVGHVGTPGPVTLRFVPFGPVVTTAVAQPGWHEWELPTPVTSGEFVMESASGDVAIELAGFQDWYDFPSQLHWRGNLEYFGRAITGVLRLVASPVANGCPAPDDDLVAGIPYVEVRALPPGIEQQRLRLPSDMGVPPNPIGTRGTLFADAVRLIDWNGQPHVRDWQDGFSAAATGPTDGGMSDPFVLEFQSDGGNLWAAYSRPPSACHPAARASLDGEESRWMAGPMGSDLIFRLHPQAALPRQLDLDGDGFRGPTFAWSLNSDSSWNDCDDANPARHPEAVEACNAIDDDCDGVVDGPRVQTTACERTAGLCMGSRHQASDCQGGEWLTCESRGRYPVAFRPEEVWCDGRDEDCDGVVDDSPLARTCGLSLGVCAASPVPACVSGSWTACDYGPRYEVEERTCDGLDNDCDGVTDGADPDVEPPACELQLGVCSGANKPASACGASGWATCAPAEYGEHFQQHESRCDGRDNDCDGLTDAEDSDLGAVLCENQLGVCAGSKHAPEECDVSTWHACASDRLPNTWEATESRCDGLDNDCDGLTDEACSMAAAVPQPEKPQGCNCTTFSGLEWGLLLLLLSVRGGSRTRTP